MSPVNTKGTAMPVSTITRDQLLEALRDLGHGDPESEHLEADELLLCFIADTEIREAFEAIEKWYA